MAVDVGRRVVMRGWKGCPRVGGTSGAAEVPASLEKRGDGQVTVTVHREGRKAEVPLGGSRQILDHRVVRRACEELGLDWSELPGPKSRV